MKYIIEILILILPALIFKLYRGRNGTQHPDYFNAMWTVIFMMGGAIAVSTYELAFGWPERMQSLKWVHLQCLAIALTGHGLFFPPLMNYILYKRIDKHKVKVPFKDILVIIFNRLSPDAVPDKFFIKFRIGWKTRLIGYVALFVCSILWFVL